MENNLRGHSKPKLLLAEDDDILRTLLKRGLNMYFNVTDVASARAAIETLSTQAPPEFLVTDFDFREESDGLTIAKFARERFKDLPILLVTGTTPRNPRIVALLELPKTQVIVKPFDLDLLLRSVADMSVNTMSDEYTNWLAQAGAGH